MQGKREFFTEKFHVCEKLKKRKCGKLSEEKTVYNLLKTKKIQKNQEEK